MAACRRPGHAKSGLLLEPGAGRKTAPDCAYPHADAHQHIGADDHGDIYAGAAYQYTCATAGHQHTGAHYQYTGAAHQHAPAR
jgi:hypothetical protein